MHSYILRYFDKSFCDKLNYLCAEKKSRTELSTRPFDVAKYLIDSVRDIPVQKFNGAFISLMCILANCAAAASSCVRRENSSSTARDISPTQYCQFAAAAREREREYSGFQ